MQTLKTYRVIIRRTIEVAVEIDSVSKASLDRDMKTCQERFDTGANDELMDLFHRGVDKHLRYDELKVKGSEPVAGMAPITLIDNPDEEDEPNPDYPVDYDEQDRMAHASEQIENIQREF